jgi:hypothetical protein
MNDRIGAPAYRGQIYRGFVELLLARNRSGDRERAATLIVEALAVAERFVMSGRRARVLALRDIHRALGAGERQTSVG